jgi:hypothetical protein
MSLGPDNSLCATEFIEAMRARLIAADLPGDNVDRPDVRPNLVALGEAVYQITTALAETHSTTTEDPAFWAWISAVQAWLSALSTWQRGARQAVNDWTPTQASEQAFRTAFLAVIDPGLPPASAPTELTGRIE